MFVPVNFAVVSAPLASSSCARRSAIGLFRILVLLSGWPRAGCASFSSSCFTLCSSCAFFGPIGAEFPHGIFRRGEFLLQVGCSPPPARRPAPALRPRPSTCAARRRVPAASYRVPGSRSRLLLGFEQFCIGLLAVSFPRRCGRLRRLRALSSAGDFTLQRSAGFLVAGAARLNHLERFLRCGQLIANILFGLGGLRQLGFWPARARRSVSCSLPEISDFSFCAVEISFCDFFNSVSRVSTRARSSLVASSIAFCDVRPT